MMKITLLIAVVCLLTVARGQPSNSSCLATLCPDGSQPQGKLLSTGKGVVTSAVAPDLGIIDFRIESRAANASAARAAGATAVNATLTALNKTGVPAEDITTTSLSLVPLYEWNETRSTSVLTGWTFSMTLQVKIVNATAQTMGEVVDGAVVASPAVQVSSLTIGLTPETTKNATNEARKLAVADALTTASVLVTAANVDLGPITMITESPVVVPQPYMAAQPEMARDVAASVPTPIAVGTYTIEATVTVEVLMCTKAVTA